MSSQVNTQPNFLRHSVLVFGVCTALLFALGLLGQSERPAPAKSNQQPAESLPLPVSYRSRFLQINEYLFHGKEGRTAIAADRGTQISKTAARHT